VLNDKYIMICVEDYVAINPVKVQVFLPQLISIAIINCFGFANQS